MSAAGTAGLSCSAKAADPGQGWGERFKEGWGKARESCQSRMGSSGQDGVVILSGPQRGTSQPRAAAACLSPGQWRKPWCSGLTTTCH